MDVWNFTKEGYNLNDAIDNGNRFLIGNGLIGIRGTLDEYRADKHTAINLAGVYNLAPGRAFREPINAPNGLFAVLEDAGEILNHEQSINIRYGIHSRVTEYEHALLKTERFVSMAKPHLICQRITIKPKQKPLTLVCGIDSVIWDLNGPHLYDITAKTGDVLSVSALTSELKTPIVVKEKCNLVCADFRTDGNSVYRVFSLSEDTVLERTIVVNGELPSVSYDEELTAHSALWDKLWQKTHVLLVGDDDAQFCLNYSLYHLLSIAPHHAENLSIPARGLSGQTYKGAIFWDSEIFLFPVFVHTNPSLAKKLLRYRIEALPGALIKASEYGYRGAFYPWESQHGGMEGCTDYNVVDVFTHRPVRTYFRDKQIHISGDIAYTMWRYYEITRDVSLLEEGGAEVILQCARFYLSRLHKRLDENIVELLDVIGPDEYHERVNNNIFTNQMAAHCLSCVITLKSLFESAEFFTELIKKLDYENDFKLLMDIYPLFRPHFNEGIIEQFDGYFKLEDCTLTDVRGRVLNEREYWGCNHGIAANTQIIKQADVIAMMSLFPELFSADTVEKNWRYYEPRTEHGSSLSDCMYALAACRFGRPDLAWEHFIKTASIDLIGGGKHWAGEVYIGGTHPAANGGAWMIAVLGFAGLSVKDGTVTAKPCLPPKIKSLRFPVTVKEQMYTVTVTHDDWDVEMCVE